MIARASVWTTLGCGLALVIIGCKTAQPELKPPQQPEVLNKPPDEARFNSPGYPKQALANNDDPTKKWSSSTAGTPGMMPTRGMGSPGGAGGPGGFGR